MSRNYSENNEWFDSSTYDRSINWKLVRRFLYDHYTVYRTQLLAAFFVAALFALTGYAIPKIFEGIQAHISERNVMLAAGFLGLYLIIILVQQGLKYASSRLQAYVSAYLNRDVTLKYYGRVIGSSVPEFLTFRRESNVFQRVIDATSITTNFTGLLIGSVMQSITVVVFLAVVASISLQVSGVLLVGTAVLAAYIMSRASWLRKKRQRVLSINYPLVTKMLDILEGLLTVKALSATVAVPEDVRKQVERKREAKYDEAVSTARVDAVTQSIRGTVLVVAMGVCFASYLQGQIQLSQFFAVYVLAEGFLTPAKGLVEQYRQLAVMSVNLENFYEVIDIRQEAPKTRTLAYEEPRLFTAANGDGDHNSVPLPVQNSLHNPQTGESILGEAEHLDKLEAAPFASPHCASSAIKFENVRFSYAGNQVVLDDVSFSVLPGEHVALIGRSGAGKTTIFRLLLGYLKPDEGEIFVQGYSLANVRDKDRYRQLFGIVSQDDYLFNIPIRQNIVFGLDNPPSDKRIFETLERVDLREMIEELDNGLGTVYHDSTFSGGQKQRMLVARALIRSPKIALLDEPTSSLDFENEQLITRAIERLVEHSTAVTIAHRLSTVRNADKIILLDNGHIRVSGTHERLQEESDYYRAFCEHNSFIA